MGWEALTPSDELEASDWIRDRLHPFAQDVGSVVPAGFEGYARIFHPAWALRDQHEMVEVRWSDVAAWSGRTVHPEMQFHSIAVPVPGRQLGPKPWSGEPRLGVLPRQQANALTGLLAKHTASSDRCCFCLWDGYGYLHPGGLAVLTSTYVGPPPLLGRRWCQNIFIRMGRRPTFKPPPPPSSPPQRGPPPPTEPRIHLPGRDYLLFIGSVGQGEGWEDGPNLWWPDDRAWCVASEIDFPYTYVGGSKQLIEEILADPLLEALAATTSQGITVDSDTVNA